MLRRHFPAALLICLGIGLSVALWSLVGGREEERLRLDLERRTDYIAASIAREMDESIERLVSIRAFLDAGPASDRRRFRLLVGRAFTDDASLLSLKWAPRVMAAERAAFEAEVRREGMPGFRVLEQGAGGSMVPAGPRAEYMPVLFAEPFTGRENQLGFDLASEPARRVALEQARDTGKPMATGRVQLVLEPGEQWGVLVLIPVYRGATPGTVEERREALRGYALGVFRIGDLVGSALKHLGPTEVDLRIEDAASPPGQRILLSRAPWGARPGPAGNGRLPARRVLEVAGRRWALEVRPTPLFLAAHRSRHEWTVLGAGLLSTALLGAYLFTSANRAARLAAVNHELEREVAERQRAEEVGERQRREAEALAEVTRAINASLDLSTVLQRVTEAARELCGSDTARLALRDPETGAMPYRYAAGTEYSGSPTAICEPGKGVGGQALATGRPFRTDCYEEDPRITRDYLAAAQAQGIVAVLAVPIRGEGQVDGVLLLDNRSPRPFTDRDEALLCQLADHAAVALRNARLYDQARTRLRQTETLLAVGQAVGGTLELPEVARRTVREAVRILDADVGGAWLLEPSGEQLKPLAGYRVPPDVLGIFAGGSVPAEHPALRALRDEGGPIYSTDTRPDPRVDHALFQRLRHKALLLCPVMVKEEMAGVLVIIWTREAHAVTAEERRLLDGVVRQAALAMDNARLLEAERRLEARKEALVALSRGLASERDLSRLLSRVASETRDLTGADTALLLLAEGDRLVFRGMAGADDALMTSGSLRTGGSLIGAVVREGRPLVCADLALDPDWRETVVVQRLGYRAMLAVPLTAQGRPVGVLKILHRAPRVFAPDEVEFIAALASHAALAIENAHLFAEAELRRHSAESLAEVGRLISESLDPGEVGRRVVESVRALLGAATALLYRLDEESGDLVAIAASGNAWPPLGRGLRLPRGTGAVGLAVQRTAPVVSANVLEAPEITLAADSRTRIEQAELNRAVLALPLLVQGQVIGALGIADREGRLFDEGEIRLAQAFADQASVALENARLHQETQRAYDELSRTQQQLTQAQKMEAIGQLAGGIAHDFNNLLTVISGRSELALARLEPGDALRREVEVIGKTAGRAADLTRQLLAFSRKQVIQLQVVDLNAVVGGMASMLSRLIGETIELVTVPGSGLGRVKADPGQIEQVIMNLVVNARDAMPGGGRLTIQAANRELDIATAALLDAKPGPYVMLAVTDTGNGMDADTRTRIFEPFFTTKEVGKGTGLGLSTVYGIVSQHGGCLDVESEPGRGTTFRVYLRREDETEAASAPAQGREEAPRGSETILMVEDDAEVGDLTREMLQALGYAVFHASRPAEALAWAEGCPGAIHLLLTDVVMPEMSGRDLADRVSRQRPGIRVLFMSGYTDNILAPHGVLDAGTAFLQKPFTPVALARKVREVLDASPPRTDAPAS